MEYSSSEKKDTNFLKEEKVRNLLLTIKSGEKAEAEQAWSEIYENYQRFVHKLAWDNLHETCKGYIDDETSKWRDIENDLFQAGWLGFVAALNNFNPSYKNKFSTYAYHYIDKEIKEELKRIFPYISSAIPQGKDEDFSVEEASDLYNYSAERRVLQILDILKMLTDENHSISKKELGKYLKLYRTAKYKNGRSESVNTLTATIENMLSELNPASYSEKTKDKFRITYDGYEKNLLQEKSKKQKGEKAAAISNFSYVHLFNYNELDSLIELVCYTDLLNDTEKERLVNKLISTAGVYYKTPFMDGSKLRLNPRSIHGKYCAKIPDKSGLFLSNLKILQQAINELRQIKFHFNHYTSDHKFVSNDDCEHILSPYHIVVYHDKYYCIGLKKDAKRIWHYRIDLMSDVEILLDSEGRPVPIEISPYAENPINYPNWNPGKYMAEHLNMGYDEPRDIRIKIKNTDYTMLHDWFSDHFEKTNEPCVEECDIVRITTSPFMIVHWALQYGDRVEIMDEEIREKIREELGRLNNLYSE